MSAFVHAFQGPGFGRTEAVDGPSNMIAVTVSGATIAAAVDTAKNVHGSYGFVGANSPAKTHSCNSQGDSPPTLRAASILSGSIANSFRAPSSASIASTKWKSPLSMLETMPRSPL